jgi:hypothetical protein
LNSSDQVSVQPAGLPLEGADPPEEPAPAVLDAQSGWFCERKLAAMVAKGATTAISAVIAGAGAIRDGAG